VTLGGLTERMGDGSENVVLPRTRPPNVIMEGVIRIRSLREDDLAWKRASLLHTWGGTSVARKGELVDVIDLDGFVAVEGADRVGLLTYSVRSQEFEVVTIHVDREHVGTGRALMNAAKARADALRARRVWLTTTNNNFRAFGFYQRWGMDLVAFYRDGVARSRTAKPSIPLVDGQGVAVRHELEFELLLSHRE
jgi:ribosomal protein S18 acetylase RimI-like enzyme